MIFKIDIEIFIDLQKISSNLDVGENYVLLLFKARL